MRHLLDQFDVAFPTCQLLEPGRVREGDYLVVKAMQYENGDIDVLYDLVVLESLFDEQRGDDPILVHDEGCDG